MRRGMAIASGRAGLEKSEDRVTFAFLVKL
jgi:hypothetical protein